MKVFYRHIIPLFFGLCLSYSLKAQCNGDPPPSISCENAPAFCSYAEMDGYCFLMTDYSSGNTPSQVCPPWNNAGTLTNWLSFYAECTNLHLIITAANCVLEMDLYLGVFSYNGPCTDSHEDPDEILFCTPMCVDTFAWGSQQFDINLSGLTVGNIYYILVAGCWDICEMTFDVLTPPCGGGAIGDWPDDIQGPLESCVGMTGVYDVERPEGGSTLHWYLDGTLIQEGSEDVVTIDWTTTGTYELCVDASNPCYEEFEDPDPTCITIVIHDQVVPIDPDPVSICHNETYIYGGVPYPPGIHPIQLFNAIGCDSNVTLTVLGVNPTVEDLGAFYLCDGTSITVHGQTFTSAQTGNHSILTQQAQPPHCDSTIMFSIAMMTVQAEIVPPEELGCNTLEILLDGLGSVTEGPPGTTVIYEWFAFGGGILGDPANTPTMWVNNQGEYCLNITQTAPDGSTICQDSACVIVAASVDLPPSPLLTGPLMGCSGDTLSYSLLSQGATTPTSYTWVIPSGLNTLEPNDSTLLVIADSIQNFTLCGFITDECGASPETCVQVTILGTDTVYFTGQTCDPAQAGVFTDTLSNQAGCDSLIVRTIALTPELRDTFLSQTCDPAEAGISIDTLGSQQGCDSIVVNIIALIPALRDTLLSQTCDPEQAGIFIDTLGSQQGCDSIVVRINSLLPSAQINLQGNTCDPAQEGTDTLFLNTHQGCDSLIITTTTLRPSYFISQTAHTCDSAQAGTDTLFLQSGYGCDSIVVNNTIYTGQYQETTTQNICGQGTSYQDTIIITGGNCDSLFITEYNYHPPDTSYQNQGTCDPSQVGQQVTVLQDANGCDSTIIIITALLPSDATHVDGFTCVAAESIIDTLILTNQAGCDSLVYIAIDYLGVDTQFVQTLTCDSALVGIFVEVIPGQFCDTVLVTNRTWAPFSTGLETIISCDPTGPASDTTFLTANSGCDSLYIRNYVYTQIDAEIAITAEDCAGQNNGSILVLQVQGGEAPYQYRLDNGIWQQNVDFNNLPPGNYTLTVQDLNGCTISYSGVMVDAGQHVMVDAGPDRQVEPGTFIDLSVQSTSLLSQIQWQATDPLGCATCATTSLGPISVSQMVTVQVITVDGCPGQDALDLTLLIEEIEVGNIYIPNSFSPNNDGINDVFSIYGNAQINRIKNLSIFDRWGNALYSRSDLPFNDPSQGWDGTYRDKIMDAGVYVYVFEVELVDGSARIYKGDVTLVK